MTCGTLLNNNFNTVAVRKMPKYSKIYNFYRFLRSRNTAGIFFKLMMPTEEEIKVQRDDN